MKNVYSVEDRDWEECVDDEHRSIERCPIFGGWLVRMYWNGNSSSTFVSDPKHEWKLEE